MIYLNKWPTRFPKIVGLDIETTGLDPFQDEIIALGVSDGKNTVILTEDYERVVALLEDESTLKVIHNALFDLSFLLYRYPCRPRAVWDSMLVERVIFNGQQIGNALDEVLARRCHVLLDKTIREQFIDHNGPLTDEMLAYIEQDVLHLPELYAQQMQDVQERGLGRIVGLENGALLPTVQMYLTGVGFDLELWDQYRTQIEETLDVLRQQMLVDLGPEFAIEVERKKKGVPYVQTIPADEINFAAWQQLLPTLRKLGLKVQSTDRATLEKYAERHPFVQSLLDYKKWLKMSTWKWDEMISPVTGRIHPDWNQIGTITGRFSGNLQQVPRPQPNRPNMRALFRPRPEHVIIAADFSQQEPRLLAGISQDRKMIDAANELDIYIAFARAIWNEEIDKKDPRRQLTKTGVLATMYGGQADGLAPKMNISVQECQTFQDAVRRTFPVAYQWGNRQLREVKARGYTLTMWGRRSYFPDLRTKKDWQIANDARNYPIQGSGADMLKLSMIKIRDIIERHKFDASFMIALHDEIVLTVRADQGEELLPLVLKAMEEAGHDICPDVFFPAEGKVGQLWDH